MTQTAVDISILDGQGSNKASNETNGNPSFREKGNLLKDALVKLGYTWNTESGNNKAVLWQTNTYSLQNPEIPETVRLEESRILYFCRLRSCRIFRNSRCLENHKNV